MQSGMIGRTMFIRKVNGREINSGTVLAGDGSNPVSAALAGSAQRADHVAFFRLPLLTPQKSAQVQVILF